MDAGRVAPEGLLAGFGHSVRTGGVPAIGFDLTCGGHGVESPCTNKNAARVQVRLRVGYLRFPNSIIYGVSRV